ncbi:hypothetical protein L1987_47092 [Smallanthus sonchifolius]|uniref:Uncharacterized protein n=1 Tax=Smallanthus sonchifolius TaxID=185202 RepID=A0ACB9G1G1_9ASTR|nr:hypothetical protein L1987_47092 [Smallanthus sonchifolius]
MSLKWVFEVWDDCKEGMDIYIENRDDDDEPMMKWAACDVAEGQNTVIGIQISSALSWCPANYLSVTTIVLAAVGKPRLAEVDKSWYNSWCETTSEFIGPH